MGRAGRSGGGGHSSGGSHSFSSSRSGSSHSFSSSGRASRSSSGRATSSMGHGSVHHVYHHSPVYYGSRYSYAEMDPRARDHVKHVLIGIIVTILIVSVLVAMLPVSSVNGITVNTTDREKLELGYGYTNNTLTDELGWIKNPERLNRELKEFYDATGVTPYIALVCRPEVSAGGNSAEYNYADQWYSENLPNEGYILLMYFDTGISGVDGNCQLICGKEAAFLIDSEAQQIFWDCLDRWWFSDADEDDLFASTFTDTSKRIMQKTKTGRDVLIAFAPVIFVVVAASAIVIILAVRRRVEAARAEETANILSQPLHRVETEEDSLLDKYSDKE